MISLENKERAEWFKSLGGHERQFVRSIVSDAVDSALFGVLCVIDGVRVVEDQGEKGSFELWYRGKNSGRPDCLISPTSDDFQHDIYV
jgi:hypothetical protein